MKKLILAVVTLFVNLSLVSAQTPGKTTITLGPSVDAKARAIYIAIGEEDSCNTVDVDPETHEVSLVPAATYSIIRLNNITEIPNSKFVNGCEYQIVEIQVKNQVASQNTVVVKKIEESSVQPEDTFLVECKTLSEGISCDTQSKVFEIQQ